jgi:hypothetical protein
VSPPAASPPGLLSRRARAGKNLFFDAAALNPRAGGAILSGLFFYKTFITKPKKFK